MKKKTLDTKPKEAAGKRETKEKKLTPRQGTPCEWTVRGRWWNFPFRVGGRCDVIGHGAATRILVSTQSQQRRSFQNGRLSLSVSRCVAPCVCVSFR